MRAQNALRASANPRFCRFVHVRAMPLIRFIHARLGAARHAAGDESGYLIVELMVGAVIMVMLALGTLSAFDGAAKVSATTKSRAIAASLAQEEQERLRTLSISQLNALNYSANQTIGNVSYSINSKTNWITDAASSTSCAANGASADYIQATTTVDSPVKGMNPIVLSTLITPPIGTFDSTHGALAVQVNNAAGAGVPGVAVSLTGPQNANDTTDANGCAFFGYMVAGNNYTLTGTKTGYVDKNGNANISATVSVTGGATNQVTYLYDQAASATITYDTKAYNGGIVAAPGPGASLENAGLSTGTKTFGTTAFVASTSAPNLFPFTDGYATYAGTCTGNKPPSGWGVLTLSPGGSPSIAVRVPSINVIVMRKPTSGSAVVTNNAEVRATATGACSALGTFTLGGTGALTDTNGRVGLAGTPLAAVTPAVPYGSYTLCADYNFGTSGSPNWHKISTVKNGATTVSPVVVDDPNGEPSATTTFTMTVDQSTGSGTCP